jgi:hypothetical protein
MTIVEQAPGLREGIWALMWFGPDMKLAHATLHEEALRAAESEQKK